MDWDVNAYYDKEDISLFIDLDTYFENFKDIKKIKIKMLGKEYIISRTSLAQMMESLEAL